MNEKKSRSDQHTNESCLFNPVETVKMHVQNTIGHGYLRAEEQ